MKPVETSNGAAPRDFLTTEEAAAYLNIKRGTLLNWISLKKFTEADGLRRFGGATRIHFPTLKARAMADMLLKAIAKE